MEANVNELVGKILTKVVRNGDESLTFYCEDGSVYSMYHDQDCCESVEIDDLNGDLEDLVGSPVTYAEELTNVDEKGKGEYEDSYTWTFYKFATVKGWVDVKWYGCSNGYYSESVTFTKVKK